jgi:hypothetical protein
MDQSEAMQIVAEVFAAGAANVPARSSNAVRQQRYRDNKKRNESVTNRNAVTPDETVTNRNETVTNRNDVTPPSISSNKKEDKKEKRGSQMPAGWRPDEGRWQRACGTLGSEGAEREFRKFEAHHRAKGTVFKNWNFGWDKWIENAKQWQPKPAGSATPSHTPAADIDWKSIILTYKKTGHWSRWAGPDPDTLACKAPPELLREFGLLKTA